MPGLQVVLNTDSPLLAMGGWVVQEHDGQIMTHTYWSKKLMPAETRYPTHDRELMALVKRPQNYRHWLIGVEVTAYTDHRALIHLRTQDTLSDRQARWVEILQDFSFKIAYIPVPDNHLADFISRLPAHAPRCIWCSEKLLRTERDDKNGRSVTAECSNGNDRGHGERHGLHSNIGIVDG